MPCRAYITRGSNKSSLLCLVFQHTPCSKTEIIKQPKNKPNSLIWEQTFITYNVNAFLKKNYRVLC